MANRETQPRFFFIREGTSSTPGDYNLATQRTKPLDVGDLVTYKDYWGAGDDNAIGIILHGPRDEWDRRYTVYWLCSKYSTGIHSCLDRCIKVINSA